ncbi:MAG: hypothetical protein ACI9U2_002137 [Bradymonadia bacterium]|jgi:hypothetical protein
MTRRASAALFAGLISTPAISTADESAQAQKLPPARVAFAALRDSSGEARAVWRSDQMAMLTRVRVPTRGVDVAQRVEYFLDTQSALFGAVRLIVSDVDQRPDRTLVRLAQMHAAAEGPVPVIERSAVLTLDANGAVTRVVNDSVPLRRVEAAKIDAVTAGQIAWAHVHDAAQPKTPVEARKVVFASGDHGVEGYVAVVARDPLTVFEVRVNGVDGSVFGVKSQAQW